MLIDKKTRWECQRCGACCRGIIIDRKKNLSEVRDGQVVCKFYDVLNARCLNYNERPFICRLYPFIIDLDNVVEGGVARPEKAFLLKNVKIHDECPGIGKGKRIFGNKSLQRKFDKMAHEFATSFKESFEQDKDQFII